MSARGPLNGLLIALMAMILFSGCSNDPSREGGSLFNPQAVPLENYPPKQIYERGEYELTRNRPEDAAYYFSEIERLYPYSDWARRALIMQAFSYHQDEDYPNSRSAAQRFIEA